MFPGPQRRAPVQMDFFQADAFFAFRQVGGGRVQAIGDGMRLIRSGEADVVLCGGAEACINRVALGAFAAARALSWPA